MSESSHIFFYCTVLVQYFTTTVTLISKHYSSIIAILNYSTVMYDNLQENNAFILDVYSTVDTNLCSFIYLYFIYINLQYCTTLISIVTVCLSVCVVTVPTSSTVYHQKPCLFYAIINGFFTLLHCT
jgi:hypothetical protein